MLNKGAVIKMNQTIRRVISAALSLFLILSTFSVLATVSFAAEVSVGSEDALISALESSESRTITLSSNISVNESEYEEYRYHVKGKHTLDLNGFSITVKNDANLNGNPEDSTLFIIESGASLTIEDSSDSKSGAIKYLGGVHLFNESPDYLSLEKITARNLFCISENASLTVSGGTFVAGNSEKEWLHRALSAENSKFEYYTGFADSVVYGTVFDVCSKATLVINRGEFIAHGASRGNTLPNRKGWDEPKAASACIRSDASSSVTVNDGRFTGRSGANVFDFNTSSTVHILAGSFNNTPATNERISDLDGFATIVPGTNYGHVNLPVGTVYEENRGRFIQNGEFLEELPGNTYIKESNGNEIILSPAEGHPTWIKTVNFKTSYAPGSKGSLDSNYDPYFSNGSTITYKWYYATANGTLKEIPSSNSKTLNLATLSSKGISLSIGASYSFRCIITEEYKGNNAYKITTVSHSFNLTTSNKYIIAGVSLTPSSVDGDNRYYPAKAPSFSVPSGANYSVSSVEWFENGSDTPITSSSSLKQNSTYYLVVNVKAKGSYTFTSDSRISYFPGASSTKLTPSNDGKSATISGYVTTCCRHAEHEYHINDTHHTSYCTVCGTVNKSATHSFGRWSVSDTSTLERSCSVCGHTEIQPSISYADDSMTVINGAVIDFGIPAVGLTPSVPSIYSIPNSDKLAMGEYSWKDSEGNDVTAFESEKTYKLTVKLSLADPTVSVFDAATTVSSLFSSSSSVTVSEELDEITVEFTVTPLAAKKATITLPSVKAGASILNSKPTVTLNSFRVIWRKDGKLLGSYNVSAGNVSDVTDLDDNDGIEFSEATFVDGCAYSIYIDWDASEDYYIASDAITLVSNYASYHSLYSATKGFATGGFAVSTDETLVRAPGVSGITAPALGKKPSTSTSSLKIIGVGYSISKVSWSKGSSSVSSFTCGNAYTVKVTLTANDGYSFLSSSGTVNGAYASVSGSGSSIVLTYTFPALTHSIDFDKAEITLPNCLNSGQVKASCSKCSLTSVIDMQALGHTVNDVQKTEPTCNTDGIAKHGICLYCITVFSETNEPTTLDALKLPANASSHTEHTVTVHDGNYHFTVCQVCEKELSEKEEHSYGSYITLDDGYTYHECECGHAVSKDGPKAPAFPVGGDETIIDNGNGSQGLGSISMDKIKLVIIIMLVFIILLIGSIIAISIILIVTREKPAPATVSVAKASVPKQKKEPTAK